MASANPTGLTLEQHLEFVEAKSAEKIAKIPPGLAVDKLKPSKTSYKGKFTIAVDTAEADLKSFGDIGRDEYTPNWRTRLYNAKDQVTIYKNVLEWIFQNFLQVCRQEDLPAAEKESNDIMSRFLDIDSHLTSAISKVEGALQMDARRHELEMAEIKAKQPQVDADKPAPIPRIALDLKPEQRLDLVMNPTQFQSWISSFGSYIRANRIHTFHPSDQISYAKTMISDDLWTLIEPKVNRNTQAVVFDDGKVSLGKDEHNRDTFVRLLAQEWLRQYPLSTRRLQLFKCKQTANETTISWLAKLEQQFEAANAKDMNAKLFMIYLAINGIYDQEIQKEAIKAFEDGKVTNVGDLKAIVRTEEVASRTSDFMKGKTEERVFMTEYKRQKNRPQNQGQQKGQNQKNNNRRRSRARSQSQGRGQKPNDKFCSVHPRARTHNTNECWSKNKDNNKPQNRGRSRDRRQGRNRGMQGRSPSPNYSSGSNSSRSQVLTGLTSL